MVVISHELWQARMGGDPDVLGKTIEVGTTTHEVVGVMPEGFVFPWRELLWMPFRYRPTDFDRGKGPILRVFGRLADGASIDVIEALATDRAGRTRVWGALDTLDNLKKGGRIGNAKAFLATALAIKPIIEVVDGQVEEGGRQRTRSKAIKFLVDKVASFDGQISDLAVLQADCDDVDQFVEKLQPHYDGEIVVGDIGPVIGTHAGKGTIGVAFTV